MPPFDAGKLCNFKGLFMFWADGGLWLFQLILKYGLWHCPLWRLQLLGRKMGKPEDRMVKFVLWVHPKKRILYPELLTKTACLLQGLSLSVDLCKVLKLKFFLKPLSLFAKDHRTIYQSSGFAQAQVENEHYKPGSVWLLYVFTTAANSSCIPCVWRYSPEAKAMERLQ